MLIPSYRTETDFGLTGDMAAVVAVAAAGDFDCNLVVLILQGKSFRSIVLLVVM